MQVSEILIDAGAKIKSATPKIDAEILLARVLNIDKSFFYTNPDHEITYVDHKRFLALLERRVNGEPISYILGEQDFWNIKLNVNEHTLIPRPETELLVETCLKKFVSKNELTIADLGTGSGAIAIALAKEKPSWKVFATDISSKALAVARENATLNEVSNVEFFQGDWCSALPNQKVDVIISNPPYIEENDKHLDEGDVRFEPKSALISGQDGLDDIRKITHQAKRFLNDNGVLMIEHGFDQQAKVIEILQAEGYKGCVGLKDLSGLDRIVISSLPHYGGLSRSD